MYRERLAALLKCMILLTGCSRAEAPSANAPALQSESAPKAEYRRISASEAHIMMRELTDYILLDVRTFQEYAGKRIDGAVLIPDYEIPERAEQELPDKNSVLLVYCQGGRRSANAARALVRLGYTRVYDFGGITNWPYDTVSNYE